MKAVAGLSHVTLAVACLDRALALYRDLLGMRLRARWADGAYLEAGDLWLCLQRADRPAPATDGTHLALAVDAAAFAALAPRIEAACPIWKANRSEGASVYFEDPDGHRLELHVGDLDSRLAHYRAHPEKGVTLHD